MWFEINLRSVELTKVDISTYNTWQLTMLSVWKNVTSNDEFYSNWGAVTELCKAYKELV